MYRPTSCDPAAGRRLRVLVVRPRPPVQNIGFARTMRVEPLELEYLCAALKEHELFVLDGVGDRRKPVNVARRFAADVVLFTAYVTDVGTVVRTASALRRLPAPPYVYVGGVHAEVMPHHFYAPGVDGVFFADQLRGVRTAIDALARGRPCPAIPGAALRNGRGFRAHPLTSPGLPFLPKPDRALFARSPGTYRYFHYRSCAMVKSALGCPYSCSFCFCREMNDGRYAARPIAEFVDEIAALPTDNVFVVDDNFLLDRTRLIEFCEEIAARGIRKRFVVYAGARFIARHPDLLGRLRRAGLSGLCVGLEFAADRALAAVNKPATLADNDAAISICRDLGIDLFALFIVDPKWRTRDFVALARYLRRNRICFAAFATMTPLPGVRGIPDPARAAPLARIHWWRYDLLRLHERPAHMPFWIYYLWLYYLYLLPAVHLPTLTRLLSRCGWRETARLLLAGVVTGIEYLLKLLVWR